MTKLKWLERLGLVCWVVTLLTFAITVTINVRSLYVFDIDHLQILHNTILSKKELLHNFDQLMAYLNRPWVEKLVMRDFPVSKSGAFHFYEVKKLFLLNYALLFLSVIPSGIYLRHLKKTKRLWTLYQPFQLIAAVPIVIAFLMAVNFDRFFVAFHGIFFHNNDWIFNPATDPIINVLPETFFLHCFIVFFVLLEGLLISQLLIGRHALKK
ncbi:TIGR01906 family membrane protein [Enterococcus sp. CSURQ0835]|uniref:TIGR01906 family membrane protein n=1 Tax=Enterococcus sp. CSURQ0835 TaxID=2681394 RepID=UPI003FA5F8C7